MNLRPRRSRTILPYATGVASNCKAADDESYSVYGCMDFGPGIEYYDNFCTINCQSDEECAQHGIDGWCQVVEDLIFFQIMACLKACTEDTYCQTIFNDPSLTCNLETGLCE